MSIRPGIVFDRLDVQVVTAAIVVEVFLLASYLAAVPEPPSTLRYTLYPLVWINVGLLAVVNIEIPTASRRRKLVAGLVAGVYLLALLWLSGLVGLFPSDELLQTVSTIEVEPGSPAQERLHIVTPVFYFSFLTFRTFGFLVLAVLVYATVLDFSGGLAAGVVGLFSCVSCTFPVVASLATGLFGSTAIATAVYGAQFDLSTLIFVVAVALLYWRPGFDSRLAPS